MLCIYRTIALLCLVAGMCTISACLPGKTDQVGTVIILNGPSAVGKSSIIKAFGAKQQQPWLGIGIDNFFVGVLPSKFYLEPHPEVMHGVATQDDGGKLFTLHVGPQGQRVIKGMHQAIAAYARAGNNVIVDYIAYQQDWRDDLLSSLSGIPVVTVGVTASLETLQQREKNRATSPEGHARSLHETVHVGWKYDLKIDTDTINPDQIADRIIEYIESKKTMNNCVVQEQQVAWIEQVKQATVEKSGQFLAPDKNGKSVLLSWESMSIVDPVYAETMKMVCELACRAYVPVELAFIKQFPEAVLQDNAFKHPYYEQLRTVFADGVDKVDWDKARDAIEVFLRKLHHVDLSTFGVDTLKLLANDLFIFVTVKDSQTGQMLGFGRFAVSAATPQGDVKVIGIEVEPMAQRRGLAKLLISSIFNIVPATKRLYLGTRVTNDVARDAYLAWGFTPGTNQVTHGAHVFNPEHWTLLEYKADQVDILQKTAALLVDVK